MVPTTQEKTLSMRLSFYKGELEALLREIENDIPTLGPVSAKYHLYFYQTLRNRLARIEKQLIGINYVEVKD